MEDKQQTLIQWYDSPEMWQRCVQAQLTAQVLGQAIGTCPCAPALSSLHAHPARAVSPHPTPSSGNRTPLTPLSTTP